MARSSIWIVNSFHHAILRYERILNFSQSCRSPCACAVRSLLPSSALRLHLILDDFRSVLLCILVAFENLGNQHVSFHLSSEQQIEEQHTSCTGVPCSISGGGFPIDLSIAARSSVTCGSWSSFGPFVPGGTKDVFCSLLLCRI